MYNKEAIKEIYEGLSNSLDKCSDIMVLADADGWAVSMDYTNEDLAHALEIFNHVMSNKAIKSGFLTKENVYAKMDKYRLAIKEAFGIDTIELTEEVYRPKKKEAQYDC
jgi:hypothetical protein